MCASLQSTCGVCLAEWTGESWMETYQNVLSLKMWTLVLNESLQLCVKGQYIDPCVSEAVCIPIKKRVNNHWIASEKTLIKLHGPLFSNELPPTIVTQFSEGIPDDWQIIAEKWKQFVAQGGKGYFSLNLNESLTSVSSRGSRNRRNISTRRKQTSELDRVQRSTRSVPADVTPPTEWVSPSPWLPAHKVKEINQWMNRSPVTARIPPEPLHELDTVPGNAALELNLKTLPQHGARTATSKPMPNTSGDVNNKKSQPNLQSTPMSSANGEWSINFNTTISSVSLDNSLSLMSFDENPLTGEFRMPTNDAHGVPTVALARSESRILKASMKSSSEKNNAVTRHPLRKSETSSPDSSNENYKTRPKRRHAAQKIERWRPVLGVDGSLKLQGYLVLRGDMTAGQILTTNAVKKWTGKAAFTCDNREYELVGDMNDASGKIPTSLKTRLLKPMKIVDIINSLQETQGLKDDVTSHFYLAPPPAPEKICTTRSGRVCRPRIPYWLNRSDWGAEYEIFYSDPATPDSSRSTSRSKRTRRNESQNLASLNISPQRGSATRSRRKILSNHSLSPPSVQTRGRKFLKLSGEETPETPLSSNKSVNGVILSSSSRSASSSSTSTSSSSALNSVNKNVLNNVANIHPNARKKNEESGRNLDVPNSNEVRNDILSKSTLMRQQNQITGGTIARKSESSIVHITPSRIKVSYLSKTKSEKTPVSNSFVCSLLGSKGSGDASRFSEIKSNAEVIRSRTARSPAKLSCEPCCGPSHSSTLSGSSTPQESKRSNDQVTQKSLTSKKKPVPRKTPKGNHATPPTQRSLRSSLRETRRQTSLKSPRLVLTPIDKLKLQKKTSPRRTVKKVARSPVPRGTMKKEKKKKKRTVKKRFSKADRGKPEIERRKKQKPPRGRRLTSTPEEPTKTVETNEDNESLCSNESDMSVGPSASVIFAMNAVVAAEGNTKRGRQRAPKTLRERRERDEALEVLGNIVNRKEAANNEDDPVAQLISAKPFQSLPEEWCDHRAWLRQNRKRRRPSSSDGTASPSRSALSDGHEDATSSVATPQLLMRRPDPKQVQSYLQRLRNMQTKVYRPTRRVKTDRPLNLPDIDYSIAFKSRSSSESGSELSEEDN